MTEFRIVAIPDHEALSDEARAEIMRAAALFVSEREPGHEWFPTMLTVGGPPERRGMAVIQYEDQALRRALQVFVAGRALWSAYQPSAVLLVHDQWISLWSPSEYEDGEVPAPSDDPTAGEAMGMMYAWTADNADGEPAVEVLIVAVPYGRDDKGRLVWRKPPVGWVTPTEPDPIVVSAATAVVDIGAPAPSESDLEDLHIEVLSLGDGAP